jgi:hypothetical protein
MTAQFLILAAALTTGALAAQAPTPKPPADTTDDRLAPTAAAPMVTVEGCVATENEIPGRKANIAERAGISEDYVLTNAKMIKGEAPVAATTDQSGGVVSNALRPMYEIGGLNGEQIKSHVGHRVRIDGSFGNIGRAEPAAPLNDDLVQLTGTSIRMVPGACAPKKSE